MGKQQDLLIAQLAGDRRRLNKFVDAVKNKKLAIQAEDDDVRHVGAMLMAAVTEPNAGAGVGPVYDAPKLGSTPLGFQGVKMSDMLNDWAMPAPVHFSDPNLEVRTFPADDYAGQPIAVLALNYLDAMRNNPTVAKSGATSAVGTNIVLTHPSASDLYPAVYPGLRVEISLDNYTAVKSQIIFTISGYLYGGGTPQLNANAATTADHYATPTADWATGDIIVVPKQSERRMVMTIHPWKTQNSKTFISQFQLANIDTQANVALDLTVDTTTHPPGTTVEATALGVDYAPIKDLLAYFAGKIGA